MLVNYLLPCLLLSTLLTFSKASPGLPGHYCSIQSEQSHCMTSTTGLKCTGLTSLTCQCPSETKWNDSISTCIGQYKGDTVQIGTKYKATLGKTCDPIQGSNLDCNEADLLTCINNICTCLPGLVVTGQGLCRSPLDSPCSTTDLPCDDLGGQKCINGVCSCKAGFIKDPLLGLCRADLNEPCDDDTIKCDAAKHLVCDFVHKTCVCRSGYVDNEDGRCTVVADGVCTGDLDCGKYAFCNDANPRICECTPGFSGTTDGRCRVKLGDACGEDEHCDNINDFARCSPKSGKCICLLGFVYNEADINCRIVANGSCDINEQCEEGLECSSDEKCVDSSW